MSNAHVTCEMLRAVLAGKVPEQALVQVLLDHVRATCPHCAIEIELFQREKLKPSDYSRLFAQLGTFLEQRRPEIEASQAQAKKELEELMLLPEGERLLKVERARGRFRGLALVELLLKESKKRIPAEPTAAFHFAYLGRAVLYRAATPMEDAELWALSTAYMANARRVSGDLLEAEAQMKAARSFQLHYGAKRGVVAAELDSLEASLKKDQRFFPEAEKLMQRAALLYGVAGDEVGAAKVNLQLGYLYRDMDQLEQAYEATKEALKDLSEYDHPRLVLCGRYNLAMLLCDMGSFERSFRVLEENSDFFEQFPEPWTVLRLLWLEGRIQHGRGRLVDAEQTLEDVRDRFVELENGYDAVMVSLDLALVYVDQKNTQELKELALEMLPVFAGLNIHREALATWSLFAHAAEAETVTAAMLRALAHRLEGGREKAPEPRH